MKNLKFLNTFSLRVSVIHGSTEFASKHFRIVHHKVVKLILLDSAYTLW